MPWKTEGTVPAISRLIILIVLLALPAAGFVIAAPQPPDTSIEDFGGGPIAPPRDLTTDEERAKIESEVAETITRLRAEGHLAAVSAEAVTFDWPLRPAAGLTDYGYHGVSGFVDHNPTIGALRDYTCGDRTYDISSGYNHQGTDFFTFPFPWLKMDHMEVEIVAAAPGTLVFKRDGQYDRQCAMTGDYSNAVVLLHADESKTWYLHMKNGSVTEKPMGADIAAGEYLGVVGSSGSSTGPHLHFEVRSPLNEVLDPYEGACNAAPSMWTGQPAYYDSAVIAVHTGHGPPFRPPCPQPETTNLADTFQPDDLVTFVTTYRDQLAGQTSTYRILRPDGTLYRTWSHASTADHYSASYWYWTKVLDQDGPAPLGTWRFEVDFESKTYETAFDVVPAPVITVTYPNGGELWRPGAMLPVRWTSPQGAEADIRVDLYADSLFHTAMITSTPNDGVQFWRAPADLEPRADYTVRVADLADPTVFDASDAPLIIAPVPTASFTLAPTSGGTPLTVTFTDTSTSLVDTRLWHFGDGITDTHANPTHRYTDTGAYTVTLAIDGPAGADVLTRTHAVTVTLPPLIPDFDAQPLLGTPPLTVTFTDRSNGPIIDRYRWSFGDGVTTTLRHPTHVYTRTGAYTVTLTVGAGAEEAQAQKPAHVRVVAHLWQTYLPLVLR